MESSTHDNAMKMSASEDSDVDSDLNSCVNKVQKAVVDFFHTHKTIINRMFLVLLLLLYLAYFAYCMSREFGDEGSVRLLVGTMLGVLLLAVRLTGHYVRQGWNTVMTSTFPLANSAKLRRKARWVLYLVSLVTMVTVLVVLVAKETPDNLISLGGLAAFIFLAWVTSVNPARVDWHPVYWGFSLQFFFAAIILRTRWGYEAFKWLGDRIMEFLNNSLAGSAFLFGQDTYSLHYFAMVILPMIAFFSSVISVLYYLGVMQAVVSVLGRFLALCLGTTPAESINTAANIFVAMTEAPLMIRPYIGTMTKSELHAIMTGGFATIAGGLLGAYTAFGVPANHLLSASVMSAPAALAISKLTYPETETQVARADDYCRMEKPSERNLIEVASAGATNSIALVGSVAVNVIAFLSILKFVNATLTWFGDRAGVKDLTFQLICSYVLYPVALFMGTEVGPDCRRVAELVGIKTFTNEFIAYESLRDMLNNRQMWLNYTTFYDVNDPANVIYDDLDVNLTRWNTVLKKGFLQPRSEVIATYALCGFSNFGSMGIMLGGLTAMAPHRQQDIAAIILRAMIAGNVACFFTACIAGLFYQEFE